MLAKFAGTIGAVSLAAGIGGMLLPAPNPPDAAAVLFGAACLGWCFGAMASRA
jgi:hypothetical protein